jgi:hypothetical protein
VPIFHFHIRDGQDQPDIQGAELASIEDARERALRAAGELLATVRPGDPFARHWQMQVTDEHGMTLFHLDFEMTDSPALTRGQR